MNKQTILQPETRFRTAYNFKLTDADQETPLGISSTLPDDSFSLAELIDRYGRGHPINVLQPVYNEHELADIRNLDMVDLQDYLDFFQGEVLDLSDRRVQEEAAAHAKLRADAEEAARDAAKPVPVPPTA